MRQDMIDFPVSDDWRDYYYELGLTPFPSPKYHSRRNYQPPTIGPPHHDDRVDKLASLVRRLTNEVAELRKQVAKTAKTSKKGSGRKGWEPEDDTK